MSKIRVCFTRYLAPCLVAASLAASSLAGDEIPDSLTTRHPNIDKTYPTWVSAEAATRPDGSLDPGLFHPDLWDSLMRALKMPIDPVKGCVPQEETFQSWTNPPDVSSFEATYKSAQRVIRARIVEREPGFNRALPGQLFEAELLEAFKGAEDLAIYYFFVPVGRVKAGRVEICKTDYRFPNVPQVGDEVVLMVPKAVPGDALLDLPFEQGLIVLRDDKALLPFFNDAHPARAVSRTELLADLARISRGNEP